MSRYRKGRVLVKIGMALGGLVAAFAIVGYSRWIIGLDPFAKYRPKSQDEDTSKQIAITYKNIEFALYDDQKQIGTCDAVQVNVGKDRQVFDIVGITNGKMSTEDGGFGFETAEATYTRRTKVLSALKGARVWNADMNLNADGFSYYQRAKSLQTVGKVTGAFYGGTILAYNLRYNPVEKSGTAGPIEWTGKLTKLAAGMPVLQASVKPWNIKGDNVKVPSGSDEWVYTKARATDGEIIITADKVIHNKKTDVVTATGNVKYFSSKSNMTCEKAVIYRKEKRADLTGNVTMLVKPKDAEKLEEAEIPPFRPVVPEAIAAGRPAPPNPAEKAQDEEVRKNNFRKYPTQIRAERIEYFYAKGSRHANVTGSPQAQQDLPNGRWRHISATSATFDVEADKLRLNSAEGKRTVRLRTSIGDDLTAKWLLVSTKENDDEMEGEEVDGTVISDDDDLNNRNSKPPPTTGGGQGPLKGKIGA